MDMNLQEMSREDKLRAMEALWVDLSRQEQDFDSPDWHRGALLETEARVREGSERILDWEDAKRELRSQAT